MLFIRTKISSTFNRCWFCAAPIFCVFTSYHLQRLSDEIFTSYHLHLCSNRARSHVLHTRNWCV